MPSDPGYTHKNEDFGAREEDRGLLVFRITLWVSIGIFAVMAAPVLIGRVYVADDLGQFHLPARAFYAESLGALERFDWCPNLFGGYFFTGEGQAGTYHPVHLVLYGILPLQLAFGLEVLLSYPIMFFGTYFLLRRRLTRKGASLFGAMLFTFSGFSLLHFVHMNAVAVIAHLPWILFFIDRAIFEEAAKRRATAIVGIALLTGSQLLLGYPQYVWFSVLTEIAFAGWLLVMDRHHVWRGAWILWAKGLGLLVGAIQWLPTADALGHSARAAAGKDFVLEGSLHPLNLTQLLAPYLWEHRVVGANTHELGMYTGAVPLVLVAWLALHRTRLAEFRPLVAAASVLGGFALLMAAGQYGYVYYAQTILPLVGNFRFPCRMIVLFHFAVAVVAAVAMLRMVEHRPHALRHRHHPMALWAIPGASVFMVLAGVLFFRQQLAAWPLVLVGPVLFSLATWLVLLAQRRRRFALVALVLLAAVDLATYGLSYAALAKTATLDDFRAAVQQPKTDTPTRIAGDLADRSEGGLRMGNALLLNGWSRIDGYSGLIPARQLDYRNLAALQIAGAEWLRMSEANGTIAGFSPSEEPFVAVPGSLPWARLVGRTYFTGQPARDLKQINPRTTVLVDRPRDMTDMAEGAVEVLDERRSPCTFRLRTTAKTEQFLVVAESFHPDWKLVVDGQPREVWRAYGDFMGCPLPKGTHEVRFEFRPASLRIGFWISVCGLGLLGATFYWQRRENRTANP